MRTKSLIMGVLLVAGVLSGCGGTDAAAGDDSPGAVEQQMIPCWVDSSGYELCPIGMYCLNGYCGGVDLASGETQAQALP